MFIKPAIPSEHWNAAIDAAAELLEKKALEWMLEAAAWQRDLPNETRTIAMLEMRSIAAEQMAESIRRLRHDLKEQVA